MFEPTHDVAAGQFRDLIRHNNIWTIAANLESLSISPSQAVAALIFDSLIERGDGSDRGSLDGWDRAQDVLVGSKNWKGLEGDLARRKGEVLFDLYIGREPANVLVLYRALELLDSGVIQGTPQRYASVCNRMLHAPMLDHAEAVIVRTLNEGLLGERSADVARSLLQKMVDPGRMDPGAGRGYVIQMESAHDLLQKNLLGVHTRVGLFAWLNEFQRGEAVLSPEMLSKLLTPSWLATHGITPEELKHAFPGLPL